MLLSSSKNIMKTSFKILLLVMTMVLSSCLVSSQPGTVSNNQNAGYQNTNYQDPNYQGGPEVSFQLFYDQLSPYGTWVSYQNYGYVWMPNAGPDFYPYGSSGQWVFTDMGWTWYSSYSWGWAPFHYGRWFYDNYYGWMWLPDTQWGPAWVTWRSGGNYYGWAPMGPGISINVAFGGNYQVPSNQWIFVNNRDIDRHNVYSYSVNRTNNTTIINNTTVIQNTRQDRSRNTTYIAGPDRDDVQRVKGRPVNQVVIRDNDRPGQNLNKRELKIYKPRVQSEQSENRRPAPVKIENLNNVRPAAERPNTRPQRNPKPNLNQRNNQNPNQRNTQDPNLNKRDKQNPNLNQRDNQNKERPKTPPKQKDPPRKKRGGKN